MDRYVFRAPSATRNGKPMPAVVIGYGETEAEAKIDATHRGHRFDIEPSALVTHSVDYGVESPRSFLAARQVVISETGAPDIRVTLGLGSFVHAHAEFTDKVSVKGAEPHRASIHLRRNEFGEWGVVAGCSHFSTSAPFSTKPGSAYQTLKDRLTKRVGEFLKLESSAALLCEADARDANNAIYRAQESRDELQAQLIELEQIIEVQRTREASAKNGVILAPNYPTEGA